MDSWQISSSCINYNCIKDICIQLPSISNLFVKNVLKTNTKELKMFILLSSVIIYLINIPSSIKSPDNNEEKVIFTPDWLKWKIFTEFASETFLSCCSSSRWKCFLAKLFCAHNCFRFYCTCCWFKLKNCSLISWRKKEKRGVLNFFRGVKNCFNLITYAVIVIKYKKWKSFV